MIDFGHRKVFVVYRKCNQIVYRCYWKIERKKIKYKAIWSESEKETIAS